MEYQTDGFFFDEAHHKIVMCCRCANVKDGYEFNIDFLHKMPSIIAASINKNNQLWVVYGSPARATFITTFSESSDVTVWVVDDGTGELKFSYSDDQFESIYKGLL